MFTPRRLHMLIRLALACFALALGAAMASPWIAPKSLEVICGDSGMMQLAVLDQHGEAVDAQQHTLDCALCLPASLPAALAVRSVSQPQPLAHALTPIKQARIAALVGAPLPPRGPPTQH